MHLNACVQGLDDYIRWPCSRDSLILPNTSCSASSFRNACIQSVCPGRGSKFQVNMHIKLNIYRKLHRMFVSRLNVPGIWKRLRLGTRWYHLCSSIFSYPFQLNTPPETSELALITGKELGLMGATTWSNGTKTKFEKLTSANICSDGCFIKF